MVELSVVVCTYNRSNFLEKCLNSLTNQDSGNGDFEVLIVDNNSIDETFEVSTRFTKGYSNFKYFKELNQGLSFARNRGFRESSGKYVAYIDDDAVASTEWVKRILLSFETTKPMPVVVGGKIIPKYERSPPKWFSDEFEIRQFGNPGFLDRSRGPSGFSGGNMAFDKRILFKYDGFNTSFGMIENKLRLGEESHLFNQIWESEPLFYYDPKILVHHWTPLRNFSISYILKRAFEQGKTYSLIYNHKLSPKRRVIVFVQTILFLLSLPLIIFSKNSLSKSFISFLRELSIKLGVLLN